MAKRRLISLLPTWNQNDDLRSFFGCTVDQVFQPGTSEPISGYIGRRPPTVDPSDFYIGEPTAERAAYQLEAGMVSYSAINSLSAALTYPDFVGYLQTNGADVSDHQRLFETEFYSWAPPINLDMLVNYRNYFWFGDINDNLPTLELTVPITVAIGDGITQEYALPASIAAVPVTAETPAVYVDNAPVPFTTNGATVSLPVPPPVGSSVMVTRVPNLAAELIGLLSAEVSDLNTMGVTHLSSGMRIKIIDAFYIIGGWDDPAWDTTVWDIGGNGIYMVDGVGLGIRLTADSDMLRGIEPQYITIDRSSNQPNIWSLYNFWVHKDTLTWAKNAYLPMTDRQAVRPIIEFVRDMVMWQDSAVLAGNVNPGGTTMTFTRNLPDLTGRGVSVGRNIRVTKVEGATITLSAPVSQPMVAGNVVSFYQVWSEATDPLFMLYDLYGSALNDPTKYPNSTFNGNRIFGYKPGNSEYDPILHRTCTYDDMGSVAYIMFSNDITQPYNYDAGVILGLYAYQANTIESPWHPVADTTTQGMTNGFYDIPLNLQANPNSDDVGDISQAKWTNHFTGIISRQSNIIGHPLGDNNYRDTARDLALGTDIVQHRAPLLKAMLLASDTISDNVVGMYDLPQAIRFAEQEYNRFRHKFIRKLDDLRIKGVVLDDDPPTVWLTAALTSLKRDKNNQFPFALNTIAGDRYFIPPTPTCLGVLPAAVPAMVTDSTYSQNSFILGHDGSLTPTFNDWHDPIVLALEQAIYDNLPPQFQTEARPGFDLQQWMGGRFFAPFNGYNQTEVSEMLAPSFELWAQQNRYNYRTNQDFNYDDPFTWNYRDVLDRNGNPLPGNWRAIYRWYYGTDVPHLRPWEMLGFLAEPAWWQVHYGLPPYSRQNAKLWTDLETGVVRDGPRRGVDEAYVRPGLSQIIPIDDTGRLLDPVATGIVLTTVIADTAARSWMVGDQGPVENAWHVGPSYRFALAIIAFLMKPVRMVEQCWDVLNTGYVGPQWVDLPSLTRPNNATLYVHGEIRDDVPVIVTGVSQWIGDHLRSSGHSSLELGLKVRGLDVRLIHRMAGFTSNDDMKVVAESFGLLPIEDSNIILYSSPSTHTEMYSGVILEWTGRSWRAIGYDARNPYFTVIPPDVNGPKGLISLATSAEPMILQWRPNTYFAANVLAEHENSVWECLRGHTSSLIFEQNFWRPRSDLSTAMIRAPRVVTYQRGLPKTVKVPYGYEFFTYQQTADFLLGWERWLVSRGWLFDVPNEDGQLLNWSLAVREFLNWAQVQWAPGNFVALSPGQQQLNFYTPTSTILNVEDNSTGFFGLADRSGRPIGSRSAVINRLDGAISVHGKDADIFACRLAFADTEHALVLSNVSIFDDDIYLPLFNLRQTRLRLICRRSRDWAGRLDAPGYVVIDNRLCSNFEKAAEDVRLMFDIEMADRNVLRTYAQHVIGFQSREYLQNLLLSDVEQFEFYQGMIQQKGAPGVFQKLMRSNRASNNSNLQFLEEWGIKISEFGAPIDPFFTIWLGQTETRNDPQIVRMIPTLGAPPDWIVFKDDSHWVDKPSDPAHFFTMRDDYSEAALPTAGPVRLSEADQFAFSIEDIPELYHEIAESEQIPFPTGSTVWVYERGDHTYTVLHSFETGATPNKLRKVVTNAEDPTVTTTRLYLQKPITLTPKDVGNYLVIDGLSMSHPELQGATLISAVYGEPNEEWDFQAEVNVAGDPLGGLANISGYFDLDVVSTKGYDFSDKPEAAPYVRVLREVRFPNGAALMNSGYPWAVGDLVWIDSLSTYYGGGLYGRGLYGRVSKEPRWVVRRWNGTGWKTVRSQPHRTDPTTISETVIYSAGTKVIDMQMIVDEPIVDEVTVIDPLSNLVAGIADRDIDFKTDSDPARYNAGNAIFAANPWGANEVGRVWWNLSRVKFLDPFTDVLSGVGDITELKYRIANWAHIAPKTSVDIYEWTTSSVSPTNYTGPGTVYQSDFPPWVEHLSVDMFGRFTTTYYFWVSGLVTTPMLPFRHTDIATIAQAITNPTSLDLPWMAPIYQDAMIVSGVEQFLNDTTTVMKVRLTLDSENVGRHEEYQLLRPKDETSLPPAQIWQKLRDSLGGFDDQNKPIPDPTLSVLRATGIRPQQTMFVIDSPDGPGAGLRAARRSFVDMVNTTFRRSPFMVDRLALTVTLYRSTPLDSHLVWAQPDISYAYEPPPANEWDIEVFSLDQRNRLLARDDFHAALSTDQQIRVLINGYANPLKQWSIWQFDPSAANALIAGNPTTPIDQLLVSNADLVFNLATSYDHVVSDLAGRDAVALSGGYGIGSFGVDAYSVGEPLNDGDRVLMDNGSDFWSIWKFLPNDPAADSIGYVPWRMQTYRTDDFVSTVEWYQSGYTATNPPVINYTSFDQRNNIEGNPPINQFVKINDDGSGRWVWMQYDQTTNQWTTVAVQNGTLELSSDFYDPSRVPLSWTTVANRDGAYELRVLADTLRHGGLMTDGELNELFFSMLNFIHVQQNTVTWAFKTSFMSIVGYNVGLQPTSVLQSDQTNSLLAYVNEVKPYHVKVREFSTQYNTDIDFATATIEEAPVFDITLLFDRYTYDAWDVVGWDTDPWDGGERTSTHSWECAPWSTDLWDSDRLNTGFIFVHTFVATSLTETGSQIQVDDIRSLNSIYVNDQLTPVSVNNPLVIRIGSNAYSITNVVADAENVSIATAPGFTCTLTVDASVSSTNLTLADASQLHVGQKLYGPGIAPSTTVTAVNVPTISISQPITQDLLIGSTLTYSTVIGVSGHLTTHAKTPFTVLDGAAGNLIEAVIAMTDAAQRILNHYVPNDNMPPLDLAALLNLNKPWCNGQPEERIQLSITEDMATTIITLGLDGRPVVTRAITGVSATGVAGVVTASTDENTALAGVTATGEVGQLNVYSSVSYGKSGYGVSNYTSPP